MSAKTYSARSSRYRAAAREPSAAARRSRARDVRIASSSSTTWEPMKPAPPVTSTMPSLMGRRTARRCAIAVWPGGRATSAARRAGICEARSGDERPERKPDPFDLALRHAADVGERRPRRAPDRRRSTPAVGDGRPSPAIAPTPIAIGERGEVREQEVPVRTHGRDPLEVLGPRGGQAVRPPEAEERRRRARRSRSPTTANGDRAPPPFADEQHGGDDGERQQSVGEEQPDAEEQPRRASAALTVADGTASSDEEHDRPRADGGVQRVEVGHEPDRRRRQDEERRRLGEPRPRRRRRGRRASRRRGSTRRRRSATRRRGRRRETDAVQPEQDERHAGRMSPDVRRVAGDPVGERAGGTRRAREPVEDVKVAVVPAVEAHHQAVRRRPRARARYPTLPPRRAHTVRSVRNGSVGDDRSSSRITRDATRAPQGRGRSTARGIHVAYSGAASRPRPTRALSASTPHRGDGDGATGSTRRRRRGVACASRPSSTVPARARSSRSSDGAISAMRARTLSAVTRTTPRRARSSIPAM